MKLDIEGSELEVMTDLALTGALQHIDYVMVEWHDRNQTGFSPRKAKLIGNLRKGFESMMAVAVDNVTKVEVVDDEGYYTVVPNVTECLNVRRAFRRRVVKKMRFSDAESAKG